MREFKFIRGIYKDENIFNTDEISKCLFAYSNDANIVQFTEKNNKDFQNTFIKLSSPDRISEVYTFRPNQFTISATKEGDNYSFIFVANKMTYDNSETIPENVRNAAETHIKDVTAIKIGSDGKPALNLKDSTSENKTKVKFTFNNKTFTRNFVFNVTGYLKERGYIPADGADVNEAYPTDEKGVIDFGNNGDTAIANETFKDGFLQKIVSPTLKTIISTEKIIVTDENYGDLDIAMSYIPGDGFKLVVGDLQIVDSLDYSDTLNFFLYSKIPTQNDDSGIDIEGITYYRVGECTVKPRGENIIVKNYAKSYENNYIFNNATNSFIPVGTENLSGDSINVYIGNEYNIIDGHVYENDSANTTKYVMFSEGWIENIDITAANATVDNDKGTASPIITNDVFRQITSVNVTATQSD